MHSFHLLKTIPQYKQYISVLTICIKYPIYLSRMMKSSVRKERLCARYDQEINHVSKLSMNRSQYLDEKSKYTIDALIEY